MPVFPEVGSMSVSPGFMRPDFSALSIIRRAIRSLTLPPALKASIFAYTVARIPSDCGILFRRTRGVLPICCVMLSMTTGGMAGRVVEAAMVSLLLCDELDELSCAEQELAV